jgi:GNAT superfamily N-acetyltransferase
VKLTVVSDASASSLVAAVLPVFAASAGLRPAEVRRLGKVVDGLLAFTLDNAYPSDPLGEIEDTLEAADRTVVVAVHDWGLPLTSAGRDFGPLPERLAALAPDARNVQLLNLGAQGKRLSAEVSIRAGGSGHAGLHHVEDAPRGADTEAGTPDAIAVRAATPDDAEGIAQLLYGNYHLSYVHPDFYRPTYLMEALASGSLVSTIALHEERVVGHQAVMPHPGTPSGETGAAVVDSAYRGLGIFGRLFERTLDAAGERGFTSVYGDAVTLHPFSQRAERSHGYRETALHLGMVPAEMSMRGFGGEGPGRRTATLRSYRPLDERPRHAALPAPYRELLEGIYENVGLSLAARPVPAPTASEELAADLDASGTVGYLRVGRWDDESGPALTRAVRHLLSQHVDVVYADVDLATIGEDEGAEAAARLNELGFFVAGLVLDGADGHDHLRLQLLDSDEIELELEHIVCDSPFAQMLRRRVLDDRARVTT